MHGKRIFWAVMLIAVNTPTLSAQHWWNRHKTATGSTAVPAEQPAEAITTPSPITDHLAVRASYIIGSVSTDAQVNDTANGQVGTPYSLEQDFGMPDKAHQARAEFVFRLHDRSRLRVGALDLSRKASQVITRQIVFGNQTYRLNERVNSTFDFRMYDFTYTYSFLRTDRFEIAPGIGIHLVQTEGTAVAPGRSVASRESFDFAGPYVTLALDGSWRITRRFSLNARYQTLDVTISDISARIYDLNANVQFRLHKNVAVGAGYQKHSIHMDAPKEDPGGSLQFDIGGPELFLRASF
jgi:hypothetical protein